MAVKRPQQQLNMGMIAGNIGISPSQKIILNKRSFRNATGGSSALYLQAKTNYDNALSNLTLANNDADTTKSALDSLDGYFQPLKSYIDSNNWHPLFQQILQFEGYGDAGYGDRYARSEYKKYIPQVQLRNKYFDTQKLTNIDWEYIYNDGIITARPLLINAQKKIVNDWKDAMETERSVRDKIYRTAAGVVNEKKKLVDAAKVELDRAIKAEQVASDQRIKELEKDPAYLKAKSEADRIVLEAGLKAKRNRNILILGLAGIALIGVIAVTARK